MWVRGPNTTTRRDWLFGSALEDDRAALLELVEIRVLALCGDGGV